MAAAAALTALACLAFSYLGAWLLTRALSRVGRRAAEAGSLDFADPGAEDFFRGGPDSGRRDEAGELSRALDHMGLELVRNLRGRLEAAGREARALGELSAAASIQRGLLPGPKDLAAARGLEIAAALLPAREVGGDFYDFLDLGGGLSGLSLGDVAGKGLPAALLMAAALGALRSSLRSGLGPAGALSELSRGPLGPDGGPSFVTAFACLYDSPGRVLAYANAGHPRPWVLGPSGISELGDGPHQPAAGVIPGAAYSLRTRELSEGETVLVFSDGVTEAQDGSGAFFGKEGLRAALGGLRGSDTGPGPEAVLGAVRRAVLAFRGDAPQSDDMALLAFRPRKDGASFPGDGDDRGGDDGGKAGGGNPAGGVEGAPGPGQGPGPYERSLHALASDDLGELRRAVDHLTGGLPEGYSEAARRLGLALEELYLNVRRHGYGAGGGPISLKRWVGLFDGEPCLALQCQDWGGPFDPFRDAAAARAPLPLGERPEGGLGILLARSLSRHRSYARVAGANVTELYFSVLAAGAAGAAGKGGDRGPGGA
jgi:serine phosphatase RsbU (regulator of sigma subunit)/anti-sigma regulatory factor (Ser/Thr protein kinase)